MKVSRSVVFSLLAVALSTVYMSAQAKDGSPEIALQNYQNRHANARLERDVRRQLAKSMGPTAGIVVVARSGAVTLEGSVPELQQIDMATQIAQAVPGVTTLNNSLTLRIAGR
jgi:hyperosmotically inducible periplasmic protein